MKTPYVKGVWFTLFMSGTSSLAVGFFVIAAWHLGHRELLELHPSVHAIQYQSAFGFIFTGAGLLGALFGFRRLMAFAAVVSGLWSLLWLIEYSTFLNFGIKAFFSQLAGYTDAALKPMAPNTALCFFLTAVSMGLASFERFNRLFLVQRVLGWIVSILALVSLLGYVLGVENAYRWGQPAGMGIFTAIEFVPLGIGLIALSWKREGIYFPIAFAASLGMLLSLYAFFSFSKFQESELEGRFRESSQDIVRSVKNEIEWHIGNVNALKAFFEASDHVSRNEFELFSEALFDMHEIAILAWAPRLLEEDRKPYEIQVKGEGISGYEIREWTERGLKRASGRPEYYPVTYLKHFENRQTAIGFDLLSHPVLRDSLLKAVETDSPVLSPRIDLLNANEHGRVGIYILSPVSAARHDSERRISGVAVGVIRIGDLIQHILNQLREEDVRFFIVDTSESPKVEGLFQEGGGHGIMSPAGDFIAQNPEGLFYEEHLEVGGRRWSVVCVPKASFAAQAAWWPPWIALGIGLLFTWLLSVYLYNALRYREALERLNIHLQTEIEERKRSEKLGASEERFRGVVEQAVDPLFLMHRFGDFIDANQRACDELGYTREELLSMSLSQIDPAFDKTRIDNIWTSLKPFNPVTQESSLRRRDGSILPAEVKIGIIEIRKKKYLLALVRDISERKLMEEQLRRMNVFLDSIIENIPNMIFVKEAKELRFVRWNKAAENLIGCSREEALGKNDYDFFPAQEADFFVAKDREVLNTGKLLDISEEAIHTRHKGKRVLHTRKIPLFDKEGKPAYLLGISEDITERKEAETLVHELSVAMENAVEGMARFDRDGHYLHVNRAYSQMMGERPEDLLEKAWMETIAEGDQEKARAAYDAMREIGKGEVEVRGMRKDGSVFYMDLVMIKICDKENRFTGHYGFIKDVSERKYRESLEIKSEMISLVAHELRTPLHSVREGVSVMLEGLTGELNDEQKDVLQITRSSLDRLVRLVNSALDFQKLEAGILEFHFKSVNINELIHSVVRATEPSIYAKGLALDLDLDARLPPASCDRDRIVQVLANLLSNAVKFTEEGSIGVHTSLADGKIKVCVQDTGIGIKSEDIPKLFRKFGQLEQGVLIAPGGTGLGLVICKKIMEEHGGDLWVQSEYMHGSRFCFTLPSQNENAGQGHEVAAHAQKNSGR